MTDLARQVAALAAKVAELEAERAILSTLYRYGHSIDYGREADWVDCFAEAGVFDVRPPPPAAKGLLCEGREALATFVAGHTRAPAVWHKHLLIEPQITVAGDLKSAQVRSYFAMLDEDGPSPSIRCFGRYLDRLILCPDGVWRFLERIAEVESLRT